MLEKTQMTAVNRGQHRRGENVENACLTSTGNYTTSGMPQQCKTLEAIEEPLACCAFVVSQDIFTPACLRHVLPCFHTCLVIQLVCKFTVTQVHKYNSANLMTNRSHAKFDCLPLFKSAEETAGRCH